MTIKRLIRLAWPLFLAQLAVAGMAVTDTFIAGRVGAEALAIVAVGSNLLLLGIMFVYGMLLTLSPMTAEMRIAKPEYLATLLKQGIILGVGAGIFACIILGIGWVVMPDFIRPELIEGVKKYIFFGVPALIFSGIYFALRLFWEGFQLTLWTAWVSFILFLFNIPLDWLFVIEMGLGGVGCAVATSVSFMVATALSLYIFRKHDVLNEKIKKLHSSPIDTSLLLKMIKLGGPASLALLSEVSLFMLLALFIAPFGIVALAAHQIAINITSVLYVLPFSLSLALSIEMGRLRGQGSRHAQARLIKQGMLLSLGVGCMLSLLTYMMHGWLPKLFTQDESVQQLAAFLLVLAALYQIMDALQMGGAGLLRGVGETRWIMKATLISYWGVGIPVGAWLAWKAAWGASGFWVGVVIALSLAAVLLGYRLIGLYHRLT